MRTIYSALFVSFLLILGSGCGRPEDRDLRRGLRELERNRPVRAREVLESALQRRPETAGNAGLLNALGVACARMNEDSAAVRAFETARRLDPRSMDAPCNLGILYARKGDVTRAAPLFEEAALLRPDRTEPLEYAAALYRAADRLPDAARVLEEARTRNPASARILNALAAVQTRQQQFDLAERLLACALELNAEDPCTLFNFAVLYAVHRGRPDQAADYVRRFRKVAPGDPRGAELAALVNPRTLPVSSSGSASVLAASATLDRARDLAARGRVDDAVKICLEEAERAQQSGFTKGAEAALQTAVELAPDQVEAHLAYGRFLEHANQMDAAFRLLHQAVLLAPDSVEAVSALVRVAVRRNDFEPALVALRNGVRAHPEQADLLWQLAVLLDESLHQNNEAADQYRLFARTFPRDPRVAGARLRAETLAALAPVPAPTPAPAVRPMEIARPDRPARPDRRVEWRRGNRRNPVAADQAYRRGMEQQKRGDWESAQLSFVRAMEYDSQNAAPLYQMAEIYRARGDLDLAQDAFQQAIEVGPDRPQARYNLATILYARGQPDRAVEELDRALTQNASFAPALYLKGLILSGMRDRISDARSAFADFLKASPNDPLADPVRSWIRAHPGN